YGSTDDNTSVEDPVYQEVHKEDVLSGNYTHYLPVKAGISARIPLTERLSVTTGLQYALYISKFTYSLSGEKMQYAHYLGVPARLDWTFASNRWLDVYAGAGMEVEMCMGATLAEKKLIRDPLCLSLLGAAGIQLNLSKRIGLYLEPELSWSVPSANWELDNYRRTHPLVFTVATGIRINIGN
ncbi:MAG: porin family protein, partial [Bacteroidales bacterium]|nr:porin family protein [Bacteroidales bacterium]